MPDNNQGTDLDKFFDSLDDDGSDVDTELSKALEDQDADEQDTDTKAAATDDDQNKDGNQSLSLEDRLALLEKENKGLRKDIVKVRGDRRSYREEVQEARDRYNRLHGMIEQMAKGGSQSDTKAGEKEDPLKDLKLAVEYDDDGNPYVPATALAEIIKGHDQKLEQTKEEILQDKQRQQELQRTNSVLERIKNSDPAYPTAFSTVEKALVDMNQRVMEIQQDKGLRGVLNPGAALDLLEQEGALDEWKEAFPTLDPDIIANAFQSERQLKKALAFVASQTDQNKDDKLPDENKAKRGLNEAAIEDKLKNKPATHGKGGSNAQESIIDKVGSSPTEDILNLSDKDVTRLLERMRNEELASYN